MHICSSRRRATSSNIRRYVESSVYAFGIGTTTPPRFVFCVLNHQAVVVFFLLAETLESRAYQSFTVDIVKSRNMLKQFLVSDGSAFSDIRLT